MSDDLSLGEFEQLVLLAVLRLREDAYGLAVRRELLDRADRDAAIGAVYATLQRLEDKGYVSSTQRVGSAERGGRARRCFKVTAAGRKALERAAAAVRRMSEGLGFAR